MMSLLYLTSGSYFFITFSNKYCMHLRNITDLDFLAPDVSPHHLANDARMEELRQLFLSGGVSFGEIFAQLSGEGRSGRQKSNTTERPATSTARLPIKHHFHWEDPPTDLIMKNKVGMLWICMHYYSYP